MIEHQTRNRLAQAASPYLRQFAEDPVHWQPWDADALAQAVALDRPILLSIGHLGCPGCARMRRESFGDPMLASVLNRTFVCIKVDRDERPDLDRVYQLALSLLTREGGGWPLTAFLDPATLVPFFGGTYFPRSTARGLPGLGDVAARVSQVFSEKRTEIVAQCGKLGDVLDALNAPGPGQPQLGDAELLAAARQQLAEQYDPADGGFGVAPRFPMPAALERLLLGWATSRRTGANDREGLDMLMHSLTRMARGGIHDHVGGGFFHYATDRSWVIPAFEKTLADNGQLLRLYADTLAVSGDPLFRDVVTGISGWLLREMRTTGGAFASTQGADDDSSPYTWRRDEVRRVLDEDEYLVIETLYGLDKPANLSGRWVLRRRDAWRSVVERLSLDRDTADRLLASARTKLLHIRQQRPAPARDDRVRVAWNGIAIAGLARAAVVAGEPDWLAAAQAAADFIRTRLWQNGSLQASWQSDTPGHPGLLDDYANLLDGLLALLAAEWREVDAHFAIELADALIAGFEDAEHGGFLLVANTGEPLIYQPKPTLDELLPSGNGVAARALLRMASLFGRADWEDCALRALAWARSMMEQYPAGHGALLAALEYRLASPAQVIVRGPAAELEPWIRAGAGFHPWQTIHAIPYASPDGMPFRTLPPQLPRLVSARTQQVPSAWWCTTTGCESPVTSLEAFRARLDA